MVSKATSQSESQIEELASHITSQLVRELGRLFSPRLGFEPSVAAEIRAIVGAAINLRRDTRAHFLSHDFEVDCYLPGHNDTYIPSTFSIEKVTSIETPGGEVRRDKVCLRAGTSLLPEAN